MSKFWDKVHECKHNNLEPNYYEYVSCWTPYCSGNEVHCADCGVFITECGCGSSSGMSGWPRWLRKEKKNMSKKESNPGPPGIEYKPPPPPPPPPPPRKIYEDVKSLRCVFGFHGTMKNTEPGKGLLGMYKCSRPGCNHTASGYDLWPSCVLVPPPTRNKNKGCPHWINNQCTMNPIRTAITMRTKPYL